MSLFTWAFSKQDTGKLKETVSVANNACWAIGEIAIKVDEFTISCSILIVSPKCNLTQLYQYLNLIYCFPVIFGSKAYLSSWLSGYVSYVFSHHILNQISGPQRDISNSVGSGLMLSTNTSTCWGGILQLLSCFSLVHMHDDCIYNLWPCISVKNMASYLDIFSHCIYFYAVKELNKSLVENSAITIGRLAWVCPELVSPHMEHFMQAWCIALSM